MGMKLMFFLVILVCNSLNTNNYSKPNQTSQIKRFAKIVNSFQPLTIIVKSSILDIHLGSDFISETDDSGILK